jgi:hypothetical protein
MPDRDELTKVWGDRIFPGMSPGVRSLYRMGRWASVESGVAIFLLPSVQYRDRAEDKRAEVEAALAAHFGSRIAVRLALEQDAPIPANPLPAPGHDEPRADPDDHVSAAEFAELPAAPDAPSSAEARLREAFPGTEEVTG